MCIYLNICLFAFTSILINSHIHEPNYSSTYASYIRQLVVNIKVSKICRPHLQSAVVQSAPLRGTNGGSCHFREHFNVSY